MDVVLDKQVPGTSLDPFQTTKLHQAELLQARDFDELVAEARQLRQRRVSMVSIRRQRAHRIGRNRLKMVLEDAGLSVCTVGFAGGFTGTLNRSFQQAVTDTRRALEFAAELNARAVVVVPGSRGRHIYNHAERMVRDGIEGCLDDALRHRVDMLIPLNPILGNRRDVFEPRCESLMGWVRGFGCHRVQAMMMLRRRTPLKGLPASWQQCLRSGGALRIGKRCRTTIGSHSVVNEILTGLRDVAVPVG